MQFVICVLALVTVVSVWWWTHRNRYWLIETKTTGTVRSRIVCLPLRHIVHAKLRREVRIFNRLCLVLPTVNGVAVAYREQMAKLLHNPKHQPGTDPYERLLYGYACYVLWQKINDEVMRRQLHMNLLFLFAPRRKIVQRKSLVWSAKRYELYPLPVYKIFADIILDPQQPGITTNQPWRITAHESYLKYVTPDVTVKRYAHAYLLQAATQQTVTLKVATDKTDFTCQINRGIVTCKHLPTGEVHTYAVRGEHVRLATSLCEKTDALEIYVTWQGEAKISLDGGQPRGLTRAEIAANQRRERIVNLACRAGYLTGERLRARYMAAMKLVPSLLGFTRVVAIKTPEDLTQLVTELSDYQYLARLLRGFSLVILYSGATAVAENILQQFTAEQITAWHADRFWLYLIDRTVTDPDVLYVLHKLTQGGHYTVPAPTPPGLVVTKNWPYVKTLTVTNTLPQKMTRDLVVPLQFNQWSVVSANGCILTVVGLLSGRISTYVLPAPLHWTGEWLTTHVNVPLKVKLAGYETRQFTITRRENTSKTRLTKKDLATAVSAIQIHTGEKKLDAVFLKPVVDGEDVGVLAAVKAAYQNQDRKLLLAALEDRHQMTMDVWQYLLGQVVGLRVRAGKIYLTPCVNIMGEFTLEFVCAGEKYAFNTRKKLSKAANFATIKYGNSNG